MYSDARGWIKIKSTDPREHPAIQFNYLSTKTDRREWIEAVRTSRNILNQPAFDPYNGGELSPGPSVETDQEILDWVAKDSETALHPSCTCRLGTGEDAVVDPLSMRVHGLEGIRVVDASALRYVTNGNIYAPTMMLAEKSADLIMGNTPLAPIPEPFYVHRQQDGAAVADGRTAAGGAGAGNGDGDAAAAETPAGAPTADV
jgi:choline dehydrogenase